MLQRLRNSQENEKGFTLIELLVVILIIAILAAIAIPVFLRQREKGWTSQMQSALKNASTALESYATENDGKYLLQAEVAKLKDEGYRDVANVTLSIVDANTADGDEFCLKAEHALLTNDQQTMYWDSDVGRPSEDACTSSP
jgi:type IV pilus assembly protein PilA